VKAHTARTRRRPIVVREGPVTVPIYRIARANGRVSFRVTWVPPGGHRQERTFPDLEAARTFAKTTASDLAQGVGSGVLTLGAHETAVCVSALRGVEGSGVRLDHAISDWRPAHDLLPPGVTLMQAVREYVERHPSEGSCPPVQEAVAAFLEYKAAAKVSGVHLKDLTGRLGKFAEWCHVPLPSLRVSQVEDWLAEMKHPRNGGSLGQRSRSNYLVALSNFVSFAERRGWIGKGSLDLSVIERRRDEREIEVFTPAQLRMLLQATPAAMIPFLTIGAFAGVRHAELRRLDWEHVGEEWIEMKASKTKTRARRLVPVLPVLAAWLAPHRKKEGPVCVLKSPWNNLRRIAQESGVTWSENGLRHSFGSYRLAAGVAEQQVANEMGNSPTIIIRHYRRLVTPAAAAEWFGVMP